MANVQIWYSVMPSGCWGIALKPLPKFICLLSVLRTAESSAATSPMLEGRVGLKGPHGSEVDLAILLCYYSVTVIYNKKLQLPKI